jgi:hypothetical protein
MTLNGQDLSTWHLEKKRIRNSEHPAVPIFSTPIVYLWYQLEVLRVRTDARYLK